MSKQTKVVKVSNTATRGFWTRPITTKSMDKVIEEWASKGWTLKNTVPVNGRNGQTTHYLLTFEKD